MNKDEALTIDLFEEVSHFVIYYIANSDYEISTSEVTVEYAIAIDNDLKAMSEAFWWVSGDLEPFDPIKMMKLATDAVEYSRKGELEKWQMSVQAIRKQLLSFCEERMDTAIGEDLFVITV